VNKINLKELAEQMDCLMEEWSYFVNKATCELISIQDSYLGYAEEPEEIPELLADWERDEVQQASALLEKWDELIPLPSKYDLNEYGMMEDFIETVQDAHIRDCLSIAIEGRGAFRRFKDTAARFGVIDKWYDFKNGALLTFVKKWCGENDLSYSVDENMS